MARVFVKRLIDKYGSENITGKKYQNVINDILIKNNDNINNQILKMTHKSMENNVKKNIAKIKKKQEFVFPKIENILPNKELNIRKQAIKGKMITQTLRDRLNKDLRESLTLKTYKGKLTKNQIENFRKNIKSTFNEYVTKKGGKMPMNIQTIATTEIRSSTNEIKRNYMKVVKDKNPTYKIKKTWLHNRAMSKEPRLGHIKMNGIKKDLDEMFIVPIYNKYIKIGEILMDRPHDINAPASEVISCNCELKYEIE